MSINEQMSNFGQNKQYCTPASIDSIVSSNGQEDHVSMGANSATKLHKIIKNLNTILAIELLNAAQALELTPIKTSTIIRRFLKLYREQVPFVSSDQELGPYIWKTNSCANSNFMVEPTLHNMVGGLQTTKQNKSNRRRKVITCTGADG